MQNDILQFDMEITYQSSYSYTRNMNSQKINTDIIFVPSQFLGHWDLTLTLPGETYIDIHTRLAWIRGGILQTIMSLGIENFIYWYNTGFRV
jgi:hypothetical protein